MADRDSSAETLVEEGLALYSQGRLDEALAKWRSVLLFAPDHHRAREYTQYVEDNRSALEDSFALAHGGRGAGDARQADAPQSTASQAVSAAFSKEEDRSRVLESTDQPTDVEVDVEVEFEPAPSVAVDQDRSLRLEPEPALNSEAARGEQGTGGDITGVHLMRTPEQRREHEAASGAWGESVIPLGLMTPDQDSPALVTLRTELPEAISGGPSTEDNAPPEPDGRARPRSDSSETAKLIAPSRGAGAGRSGDFERISSGPTRRVEMPSVAPGGEAEEPARAGGRTRKATALTLIGGGAGPSTQDFEPEEATPVGLAVPTPTRPRLVGGGAPPGTVPDASLRLLSEEPQAPGGGASRLWQEPRATLPGLVGPPEIASDRSEEPEPKSTVLGLGDWATPTPKPVGRGSGEHATAGARSRTPLPAGGEGAVEKVEGMLAGARQLYEQGTFEGSLWLCERVLSLQPDQHEAVDLLARNRKVLLTQYRSQLGDLHRIPVIQIPQQEIVWHKLDHRAGFLLSRIDGHLTFEEVLDVSGMDEFEACRILAQLLSQAVIGPRR
jgi:hypothetical protein